MFKLMRSQRISSMPSTLRSRLTYANVMSTIAVFLALGGGSFAAVSGNKDSGDQGAHHQRGDGSGGDGGGGGDQGGTDNGGKDKGGKGGQSNKGDNGNNGGGGNDSTAGNVNGNATFSVTTRDGDPVSTDRDTGEAVASAACDKDEQVVGGGVKTAAEKDRVRGQSVEGQPVVMSSGPDGDGWSARVVNSSGLGAVKVTAYAICASSK